MGIGDEVVDVAEERARCADSVALERYSVLMYSISCRF